MKAKIEFATKLVNVLLFPACGGMLVAAMFIVRLICWITNTIPEGGRISSFWIMLVMMVLAAIEVIVSEPVLGKAEDYCEINRRRSDRMLFASLGFFATPLALAVLVSWQQSWDGAVISYTMNFALGLMCFSLVVRIIAIALVAWWMYQVEKLLKKKCRF